MVASFTDKEPAMHVSRVRFHSRSVILVVALILVSSTLYARVPDKAVVKRGEIKEDIYLAGGTVDVIAKVHGDVVAAGGQVTIDNEVTEDLTVAGGNVTVRARVG